MTEAELDALAERLCKRLMESPRFEGLLTFVSERAAVKYHALGKSEVPRLIVASYAARGLAIFVNRAGGLEARRIPGALYCRPEEELKALFALYKQDVIRYIRTAMPHRDEGSWQKMQEEANAPKPSGNGALGQPQQTQRKGATQ